MYVFQTLEFTDLNQFLKPAVCLNSSCFYSIKKLLQDLIYDVAPVVHLAQVQRWNVGDQKTPHILPKLQQTTREEGNKDTCSDVL